jgi:oligopeptide transport system substrate-binding protein
MDQATTEQDLAARAELLGQAEKIAMDETAAFPIYWYIAQNVVSPNVTGFVNNASDIHRTRWLSKSE